MEGHTEGRLSAGQRGPHDADRQLVTRSDSVLCGVRLEHVCRPTACYACYPKALYGGYTPMSGTYRKHTKQHHTQKNAHNAKSLMQEPFVCGFGICVGVTQNTNQNLNLNNLPAMRVAKVRGVPQKKQSMQTCACRSHGGSNEKTPERLGFMAHSQSQIWQG